MSDIWFASDHHFNHDNILTFKNHRGDLIRPGFHDIDHMNEEFEEKIRSRFRDEFSYESFSEGEKMRIDLSILCTWRAIARLRNSSSCNLLILDEVFDGSLDTDGIEEVMGLLMDSLSESNVFIISHKEQLLDKFDQVIRFEKVKNFTRFA